MKVFSHLSVCILLACAVAQFHVARAQDDDGDMDMLMDEELEMMMMFDPCGNFSNYTNATMMLMMNYSNFTLCNSTDVPTSSSAPSVAPSMAATAGETPAPTTGATPAPTKTPTTSPSASPVASPTASPSKSPTGSPSASPSASPTISPEPSASPSSSPSASPTFFFLSPTFEPTLEPTDTAPLPDSCSLCVFFGTELDEDNYRKGVIGPDGQLTTCQGFDNLLSFSDLTDEECLDFEMDFDGIDITAYCECRGSSYPDNCELCSGGVPEENERNNFGGLTCLQWNDWARAAINGNACDSLEDARNFCC